MPAAAVIPAPIAYIKVVAVKKLVVGFLLRTTDRPIRVCVRFDRSILLEDVLCLTVWYGVQDFYFEEIRVFQAGFCREYFSME